MVGVKQGKEEIKASGRKSTWHEVAQDGRDDEWEPRRIVNKGGNSQVNGAAKDTYRYHGRRY